MRLVTLSPAGPPVFNAQSAHRGGTRLLAITAGLVGAAAFPNLRLDLGGLQMPLHVIPLLLAIPLALPRLRRIPARVRGALVAFTVLFALSVLRFGGEFGDLVKMMTSVVTLLTVACLVRTRDDFLAGVFALAFAVLVINGRGFARGFVDHVGYEPMRGIANKNAYSIYSLPVALLAGFALQHFQQSRPRIVVLAICTLSTVLILFTGANRSGWGGVVVIGALLALQARNWRALMIVLALALLSFGVFSWFGSRETFDYRLEQTTSGYDSDEYRRDLFVTALEIGIENPILGVSVQQLPRELAKRTSRSTDMVDSHNFIGYIAGGSGLFTLLALLALAVSLWMRPARGMKKNLLLAHDLLRMLLVLFVFRGFFSREVFTVATFPIGVGLALGLTLVDDTENWALTTERNSDR